MQLEPRHKSISFWNQDIVALLLVVVYIALMIAAMWAWSLASAEADAFAGNVHRVVVHQSRTSAGAR